MSNNKLILLFVACIFTTWSSWAQCPNTNTNFAGDQTPPAVGVTTTATLNPGDYVTLRVCEGAKYSISTCSNTGTVFDTEITLFDLGTGELLDYNDDNCGLTFATSDINWVADRTDTIKVAINLVSCQTSSTSFATLEITQDTACGLVPITGSPFVIQDSVIDASCDGYSDGEIHINISGGLDFVGGAINQDCNFTRPICGDSIFNVNTGSGHRFDVATGSACFEKEINSSWFEIKIGSSGNLAFTVTPEDLGILNYALYDFDFALYGPNPTCGSLGIPLRCSAHRLTSLASNRVTGLQAGETDTTEGNTFDNEGLPSNGMTKDIDAVAGETYYMLINYPALSGLGVAPDFEIAFQGTAVLDCSFMDEYSVTWTGPNGYTGSGTSITGLDSGLYIVTVEDHWGNIGYDTILVSDPEPLIVDATTENSSCFEEDDASISASAVGGTPPYTYSWDTGATSSSITALSPGSYTVTVTDSQGCTDTETYSVTEPPKVVTSPIFHN